MLGVVGLGIMGAGIVEVFAKGGHHVVGVAESDAAVELGQRNLAKSLDRAVSRGKLSQEESDAITSRVTWSSDFSSLKDCDLVVEAAPEKMALKESIFASLDEHVKPGAVLATNTSSLSVSRIAQSTGRPDHVVGMHFFNPAPVQKFIEVIAGENTDVKVIDQVADLARALGKHPAVIADRPGFIVNRLLLAYINHALLVLDQGRATAMTIDAGIRANAGFPMGPIELADLIGLDTCLEVINTIYEDTSNTVHKPAASLVSKVSAGELGRKSAKGYYDYSQGNPEIVSSDSELEKTICDELISAYEQDARAMRDSGYASETDIDAGMRLGCGLPHGPFGH